MALVADPALLPGIVEAASLAAVVIDEIDALAVMGEETGDGLALAEQQSRGAVAIGQLLRAAGLAPPALRGQQQERAGAALDGLKPGEKCRGGGALGPRDVQRRHGLRQIQRRRGDAAVLAVVEGQAGGGEMDRGEISALEAREAIAAGLHRHGDGILVPIGHGPLAPAEGGEAGVEPGIGRGRRLARQAQPREIGPKSEEAHFHGPRPDPRRRRRRSGPAARRRA